MKFRRAALTCFVLSLMFALGGNLLAVGDDIPLIAKSNAEKTSDGMHLIEARVQPIYPVRLIVSVPAEALISRGDFIHCSTDKVDLICRNGRQKFRAHVEKLLFNAP